MALGTQRPLAGINVLPSDVLPIIFSNLGARDLAASALTCTEFYGLTHIRQGLLHMVPSMTYLYTSLFSASIHDLLVHKPLLCSSHGSCQPWPSTEEKHEALHQESCLSRLAAQKARARRCCRRWIWWANARALAQHTPKETAEECKTLSTKQLVARVHALPSIQPYALLSSWSYLHRAVWICGDAQVAPATVLLCRQLMAAFGLASQGRELGSFMHKFRSENRGLSLFGWQEAFPELDPLEFDSAVKCCAQAWPRGLIIFMLSML